MSAGNTLDIDETKVPNSLVELAARLAFYGLMRKISLALSSDEKDSRKEDADELKAIYEKGTKVETADAPAGSAEMQSKYQFETVNDGNTGNSRDDTRGL